MKTVCLQGGLGNQMFQYAFYRYMKARGFRVHIDASSKSLNDHTGFELTRIFPQIRIENKIDTYVIRRIKHIVFSNLQKYNFNFVAKDQDIDIRDRDFRETIYYGYWQQSGYIDEIRTELLRDFSFCPIDDEKNKVVADQIKNTNSVSVHIRRGDYCINAAAHARFGNICTLEYYKTAIQFISDKAVNPRLFVFSDDIAWVKENFSLQDAHFIDWNIGKESFRDMQLMSLCKHNIIANSSFSWWGACLNQFADKIVIAQGEWINDDAMGINKRIMPNGWIRTQNFHN